MTTTKKEPEHVIPEGHVLIQVTKLGAGKLFTGVWKFPEAQETFKWKDFVVVPREVADAHEKKGWGEIQE